MSLSVEKVDLPSLDIEDICLVLRDGLSKYFESSSASVVDCPDLKLAPFNLAASGLGGQTAVADVGGPPYLIPLVQRNKVYSFEQISKIVNIGSETFLLGASAGPFNVVGQNCELMPNVSLRRTDDHFEVVNNNTHFAKVTNRFYFK